MMRMDASSMSWLRFAGASESPDGRGVFSDQWKQMKHQPAQSPSIVQHFNMLVLDGHCPAVWLENILASTQINDHPGCQGKSLAETSRNASPFLSESGPNDADSIKARLVLEEADSVIRQLETKVKGLEDQNDRLREELKVRRAQQQPDESEVEAAVAEKVIVLEKALAAEQAQVSLYLLTLPHCSV